MSRNYQQHPECFPEHNALHNPIRPDGEYNEEAARIREEEEAEEEIHINELNSKME